MLKKIIIAFVAFKIVHSSILTGLQYITWKNNEFSKLFLPPYQPIDYFVKYSFMHFWLDMFLGITVAFLFYLILKILEGYFKKDHPETEFSNGKIGLLGALMVGWPNFIVFIIISLFLAVILSAYRGIIYKKTDVSLFWPFVAAIVISIIFGSFLTNFFHLAVLHIA